MKIEVDISEKAKKLIEEIIIIQVESNKLLLQTRKLRGKVNEETNYASLAFEFELNGKIKKAYKAKALTPSEKQELQTDAEQLAEFLMEKQ